MAFIQIVVSIFFILFGTLTRSAKSISLVEVYEKVKKFLFSVGENAQKG